MNQIAQPSLACGVPQGSILVSLLFNLYMLPLGLIMKKKTITYHYNADDTLYIALSSSDFAPVDSLRLCIDQINGWMCHSSQQLNKDKTDVIVFGTTEERLKM